MDFTMGMTSEVLQFDFRQHWIFISSYSLGFSSVQFSCSVVSDSLWPHESQHARPPSPTPGSSLKLTSIESVMPSSHLILCRPFFLLPPIPPSIRVFSNESTLRMRWPKYWSFSFSIIPSKEHPTLISFRMDWLDLLAVQRTLRSLLQHHSLKASILWLRQLINNLIYYLERDLFTVYVHTIGGTKTFLVFQGHMES